VNIGAPGLILSVIRDGYKSPFIVFPPPKANPNNGSALKERDIVSEAIINLIRNKCLEALDHPPAIINSLSVSLQSLGRKGLILDLRHVNLYIFRQKFKCEDLSVALKVTCMSYSNSVSNPGITRWKFFLTTEDFWPSPGILATGYFQSAVLPFRFPALCLFTKLLKPVVTSWRCKAPSQSEAWAHQAYKAFIAFHGASTFL